MTPIRWTTLIVLISFPLNAQDDTPRVSFRIHGEVGVFEVDFTASRQDLVPVLNGPVHRPAGHGRAITLEILHPSLVPVVFTRCQPEALGRYLSKRAVGEFRVIPSAGDAEYIENVEVVFRYVDQDQRSLVALDPIEARG